MKHTKKLIVALCAVVCAFAMAVPAFAATIEVQDVLDGETYTAYKILNYTDNGKEENDRAVSYYLTADEYTAMHTVLEAAGFHFTQSADKTQWYVDNAEGFDPAAAAAYLGEHVADLGNALGKFEATGADGKAVFTDLGTGYYFVTSSMGTLCALHEDGEIATAVEKNTMITDAKTVDESSANAQVGDVLNYTITLTDGKGTNLPATVTDTLSKGLTYNADAKASINGGAATPITGEVTPQTDGSTKVVYTFDAATMTALEEGQKIVITYTATVNADASIDGTVSNTEYTEYSKQKTTGNTVEVDLTDLTVNKTDGTKALKGAQFKLYRTDSALGLTHVDVLLRPLTTDELAKIQNKVDSTVYYTVDPNGTNLIDMAQKDGDDYLYSSAVVYGLDKDSTYYLEETKAPEGYNLLAEEKEVAGTATSIDVVNNAGTVLPSTGGMGTTILYIVGGIMIVVAAVFLVGRRRASKDKDSDDQM